MIHCMLPKFGLASIFESSAIGFELALLACVKAGFRPLYYPELEEICAQVDEDHFLRLNHVGTGSGIFYKRTKNDSMMGVVAHCPHYFSDPDTLKKSREAGGWYAQVPEDFFNDLLSRADGRIIEAVEYPFRKTDFWPIPPPIDVPYGNTLSHIMVTRSEDGVEVIKSGLIIDHGSPNCNCIIGVPKKSHKS